MLRQKYSLLLVSTIGLVINSISPAGATVRAPVITNVVGGPVTQGQDHGYGGLKWTFGEGFVPEIVVGYRHAEVGSNGNVQGGDFSFSFKVTGDLQLSNFIQPGKVRVKYFNGVEYLQGEVGGGYDFKKGLFAGISAQGPYSNAGVDYHFSAKSPYETFLEFNSLGIYNKPKP